MADLRFFAKLDVGYFDNPKMAGFVDEKPYVPILHLRAILYARQHFTDGVFPIKQLVRLAGASYCGSQCDPHSDPQCDFCAAALAGLFVRIDDKTAEVHDYLEHQDSAADVKARSDAGKKGAASRWGADRNAKGSANRIAGTNANRNAEERRGEERTSLPKTERKKPATTIPDDWKPTTSHQKYATDNSLDLSTEAFRFRNHAGSVDRRAVNWNLAFTNWLSKAKPSHNQRTANDARPEGW